MAQTAALPAEKPGVLDRPELLPHEVAAWRSAIAERCGLDFGEARARSLARSLWGRAREVGARSFGEYRRYLATGDADEWQELLETLVNRETRFWRHAPSFEALRDDVVPTLARSRRRGDLRLLSAGCSTGEEVYSMLIAALVALAGAGVDATGLRAVGCDLSEVALVRARRARYGERSVASLPAAYAGFLDALRPASAGAAAQAGSELRRRAVFVRTNLAREGDLPEESFDVVFCQNVLIHFEPCIRFEVVERLASRLRPGGFLFLAPGEVVGLRLPGLENARLPNASAYRRVA